MSWRQLALAVSAALLILGLMVSGPIRYPDCGPTQDCPQGTHTGWPMTFLKTHIECGGFSDGNGGCAAVQIHRYNYQSLAIDLALLSGGGFLIIAVMDLAKRQLGAST